MVERNRKKILFGLGLIGLVGVTGCGYSDEEKTQIQKYESQASENAVRYISEKYGFEAEVLETEFETVKSFGVPDFSPDATGDVLVFMEYNGKNFSVMISGEKTTSDGIDNYQLEQIQMAIEEQVNSMAGFSAREIQVLYGSYYETGMDLKDSGLIRTHFDGDNLLEVLSENDCQMICSGVNEDLSLIDGETVKELFGDGEVLFVSYRSDEAFENAGRRSFNLGGTPLAYDVEDKAIYIEEYRVFGGNDEEYAVYDLREQDGIYYVPADKGAQVILTETVLDDASNWNGHGFKNAEQVLDAAYEITSESSAINLFIPVELLESSETADTVGMIVFQCAGEDGTEYKHAVTSLTEDGRYLTGTIYMRDYQEMKISVLRNRE